ncbi:MAG: ferritin-like domain-containing protein [bacterium]|nr:ferritin-like domain-containing protein [bacterium]
MIKDKLVKLLNHALGLEHAARIQYLAHAELVGGLNAEPIIARLKEIASDEEKHEGIFRTLISDYLGGVPSMEIAKTTQAKTIAEILKVNLKAEKEAVEIYAKILEELKKAKDELPYEYLKVEHDVRHILMDEQEHAVELKILLGQR